MKPHRRLLLIFVSLVLFSCRAVQLQVAPTRSPALPAFTLAAPATQLPNTPIPASMTPPAPTSQLEAQPTAPFTPTQNAALPTLPGALPPANLLTAGDPFIPGLGNQGYDVLHYTLQLTLNPQQPGLQAETTIEATATHPALDWVALDFAGFEIDTVTLDGNPVAFTRQGEKLLVAPAAPLPAGTNFRLAVVYHGLPSPRESRYAPFVPSLGLQYKDGNVYAVGEPEGAHFWFPCNDHPRDKAIFTFELTVPSGLVGVASGVLADHQTGFSLPGGAAAERYTWEQRAPMATYLATVAVGNYQSMEGHSPRGILRRDYVFPDLQPDFEQTARPAGSALDWMSDLFGAYPYEVFGYVTVRGFGASLETQSLVLLDESAIDESTMIHEMAHMWFGDWVSLDSWSEIWRNEGFATYISLMWADRQTPGILKKSIAEFQQALDDSPPDYPLDAPPPGEMFGRASYIGGAVLVHALRQEMGDQAFFEGLREYFREYGGKSASQAQFQAVMEAAAGRPLDRFFQSWFTHLGGRAP